MSSAWLLAIPAYNVIRVFANEFFYNFRGGAETYRENLTKILTDYDT